MNKIYKVIRHQANSTGFELGSYSSCEKAEEALQWIVNCSPRFDPLRCNLMEFYEIKEYPIDLRPVDTRCNKKIRSFYFDYNGNFISEFIIVEGYSNFLCLGHIDCNVRLEVYETYQGEIMVQNEETEDLTILATLHLLPYEYYTHFKSDKTSTFVPYIDYNDYFPLSDEQLRAVMNLLKGPCRNKRFNTNWDYVLMRWCYQVIDGIGAYADLNKLRKEYKLPDTEEFIRRCNYNH